MQQSVIGARITRAGGWWGEPRPGGCRTSMVRAGWVEVIGVGMGQAAWR